MPSDNPSILNPKPKTMNVPSNAPNTRFFTDTFARYRPALTFNGFSQAGDKQFGLDFKKIVEFSQDPSSLQYSIIKYVLEEATLTPRVNEGTEHTAKTFQVNQNSQVFQTRAFIALLTLILEENDLTVPGIDMISHTEAMEMLRTSMLSGHRINPLYANEILTGPDRVKWTTSLANMSRGWDLYLALENAYGYYARDESVLLTRDEKAGMLNRHLVAIQQVLEVVDSNVGIGALISGNWSLKMWCTATYACLATQFTTEAEARQQFVWFGRGLRRSAPGDVSDKRRYWTFMSSRTVDGELKDSQRTWAEGPYYLHFTLQDVIPFWHAIRAQGFLKSDEHNVEISDPFFSPWFTEPLDWLADLTTMQGETPPFDDGNRRPMFNANLMTWSPEYGNGTVSGKMNWIFKTVTETNDKIPDRWEKINADVLLVQLAMPQTTKTTNPLALVANRGPVENHEDQLIIRRVINGKAHYVCLHGEHDLVSIERGEGHEQPDQLQLLYYVDDQSIIMDAGYDRGFLTKNSSWNRYSDHNVMAYAGGDSGMSAPNRFTKNVRHKPVDALYLDPSSTDALYIMRGSSPLEWQKGKRLFRSGYRHETDGRYERTVLFVADPVCPYLIDINQVTNELKRGKLPRLRMRYHVASNAYQINANDFWHTWTYKNQGNVYLVFGSLEKKASKGIPKTEKRKVEERFRQKQRIKRFSYTAKPAESLTTVGIFCVEQTKPQTAPFILSAEEDAGDYKIWQWENRAAGSVDVLVVRNTNLLSRQQQPVQFKIDINGNALGFSCVDDMPVGFVRCQAGGNHADHMTSYGLDSMPASMIT